MAGIGDQRYVIILAYHFPPMVGAPSQRAANFAKHLPNVGWTPIIVTARSGLFHRDDREEVPAVRVERTPSPEPAKAIQRLRKRGGAVDGLGAVEVKESRSSDLSRMARRVVRDWIYIPDGQFGWIPFAAAAARRVVEDASAQCVVLSSSGPVSAHLAGYRAARRTGTPWVAEFRDPWATSSQIRPRSAARGRLDRRIESVIVANADRVVVTAERTAAEFKAEHPDLQADQIAVVRNGFDPAGFDGAPPPATDPLTLVYSGTVLPHVSVEPLIEAVSRIARRCPGEVNLRVVGPSGPWGAAAGRLAGAEWLKLEGVVPAAQARATMASASVNVLCRPDERDSVVVPAKMYEYLGARRPILAIVPGDSEVEQLGREFGDIRVVHVNEAGPLEDAIESLVEEHKGGLLDHPVAAKRPLEELSWERQVMRLGRLLDEVTAGRPAAGLRSA